MNRKVQTMFIEERHQAILRMLEEKGSIRTLDIQSAFDISYDSAKRDLRILEEKGLLKRTHGGAILKRQVGIAKPAKMTGKDIVEVRTNYMAIAKKAVSMIKNNDVVYITHATLGYFMVQNLPEDIRVRVVTNSIVIAEELRKRDNVMVIMLGGEMDDRGSCRDAFAIDMIRKLRFDKCFITAAGISPEFGLSIQRSQSISYVGAVMESARKVIGLFPVEKIGMESIVSFCAAERLDVLITDWETTEEDVVAFRERGIDVVVVEKV